MEDHTHLNPHEHSSEFAASVVIEDVLPVRNVGACGSHRGADYCLTHQLHLPGCLLREEKLITEPRLSVVRHPQPMSL